MFGSVATYLNAVQRTWDAQDGNLTAQLISLRDRHASNRNLQVENADNLIERILCSPIDEIVSSHVRVLYHLSAERKSFLTFSFIFWSNSLILFKTFS